MTRNYQSARIMVTWIILQLSNIREWNLETGWGEAEKSWWLREIKRQGEHFGLNIRPMRKLVRQSIHWGSVEEGGKKGWERRYAPESDWLEKDSRKTESWDSLQKTVGSIEKLREEECSGAIVPNLSKRETYQEVQLEFETWEFAAVNSNFSDSALTTNWQGLLLRVIVLEELYHDSGKKLTWELG